MKRSIWIAMFAGSTIGGLIPNIWGAGPLSFSSILFGSLGAMTGIYVAFKMTH